MDFGCFSLETKSRSFHQILNSACLEPSMDLVPTAEAKAELEKKAELDSIVSCKKEACSSLALHLSHTSQRLTQGPLTSHINHSSRPNE